ncbi:hypothetical protein [Janthinobacterium sp. UMAB-56]|uniref:hypothetical protein n=1 Tax=Janthinobacterium sp. UMAB-56 TaxID=1365361 RepID=UPI001C59E349|nr:hypothetical protein [Janthinobacterium sp. UMAB-56]
MQLKYNKLLSPWTVQRRLAREMLLQSRDSLSFPLFNLKGYPMKKILIASAILCFASAQAMAQTTPPVVPAQPPAAGAAGATGGGTAAGVGAAAGLSTSAMIAIGAAVAVVAGAASSDSTTTHHAATAHK